MPRVAISNEQRLAIRRYHRETRPKPRQIDIAKWFQDTFGHRLRQSTISESLSDRFAFLDTNDTANNPSDTYRKRPPQWPILEAILFDWHQLIEQQGVSPSGDILISKAKEIWPQIPDYQGQIVPQFSIGWLDKFKKRYNLRRLVRHGEAASVPPEAAIEMRAIQTLCGEYSEDDIYNMDETGLFWRQSPSGGLSSAQRPGMKRDKNRISIVCCTNYTGTRKMPLWLIGKAKNPRALRGINVRALGCEWRWNKKAWMMTILMSEWLYAFYQWIGPHREVILLMDNLSSHIAGVEVSPPPSNIRIQWLPKNSTSLYQPLDQGIIQNLKSFYKKRWLQFIVDHFEQGNNPMELMNLHRAVDWISRSWDDVTPSTIYRCFRKAKIAPNQEPIELPTDPPIDLSTIYERVRSCSQIQNVMSLQNFLNPLEENLVPQGIEVHASLEDIIMKHTSTHPEEEVEEDEEEDPVEIPPELPIPGANEALRAVKLLQRYHECQDTTTFNEIQHLRRIERTIVSIAASKQHQETLDRWIM